MAACVVQPEFEEIDMVFYVADMVYGRYRCNSDGGIVRDVYNISIGSPQNGK